MVSEEKKFTDFSASDRDAGFYQRLSVDQRMRVVCSQLGLDSLEGLSHLAHRIPPSQLTAAVHATLALCRSLPDVSVSLSNAQKAFFLGEFGSLASANDITALSSLLWAALEKPMHENFSVPDLERVVEAVAKDSGLKFDDLLSTEAERRR
jgi:hypothetical protein